MEFEKKYMGVCGCRMCLCREAGYFLVKQRGPSIKFEYNLSLSVSMIQLSNQYGHFWLSKVCYLI